MSVSQNLGEIGGAETGTACHLVHIAALEASAHACRPSTAWGMLETFVRCGIFWTLPTQVRQITVIKSSFQKGTRLQEPCPHSMVTHA